MQWRQRQFNRVCAFDAEKTERVQAGIVGSGPERVGVSKISVTRECPGQGADPIELVGGGRICGVHKGVNVEAPVLELHGPLSLHEFPRAILATAGHEDQRDHA